jgi:hypothetical protein
MTEHAGDPRARIRRLPEPVRLDEKAETSEVAHRAEGEPTKAAWEQIELGGPGLP